MLGIDGRRPRKSWWLVGAAPAVVEGSEASAVVKIVVVEVGGLEKGRKAAAAATVFSDAGGEALPWLDNTTETGVGAGVDAGV